MKYCKDCVGFDECKTTGRTVEFAVDDGVCIDFDERKPQTNGDRIRSMSDEELADFFRMWCRGMEDCADCHLHHEDCPGSCEFSAWIKWLQQPAEKPEEEGT